MKSGKQRLSGENGEASPSLLGGLVEAALAITRQRRETLGRLRKALDAGNDGEALDLARELCGLNEKSDRTDPRVN